MIEIIQTRRTTTRPSVDIPFYKWPDSFISFIEENYVNTKKLIGYKIELSEDKLTEIRTSIWASLADFQMFINSYEASDIWEAREQYQLINNITGTITGSPIRIQSLEEIASTLTIDLRNQF
jgi:hypothetical protein